MDRLNISGNNLDIARANFVKSSATAANDDSEAKVDSKATSEAGSVGVESDISASSGASAESSIKSATEAKDIVAKSVDNIIKKADRSVLAQANQSPKEVMSLLQFAS